MASTILDPVAVLIANVIAGLAVTPTVKAHWPDPGLAGVDQLPAGVVGAPDIDRVGIEEPDPQIGSAGWTITYPVALLFDLGDTVTAQAQALQTVEAFIKAIDTMTLSVSDATIEDSRVLNARVSVEDAARPLLIYDCAVAVLKFVT